MSDIFKDQEKFMIACDQDTTGKNDKQFNLYVNLIDEEVAELKEAIAANDTVEILDALVDIIVVTAGAGHSMGFDLEGAWDEVMRTNFAKINAETGKVIKREDKKILKPPGWQPPHLTPYLSKK